MSCTEETGSIFMPDGSAVSYDGLPSTAFKVLFDKLPTTIFFLQKLNIPGIEILKVERPTPYLDIDEVGEKPVYSPLDISFLVSSDLKNYREIHDWMMRIVVGGKQKDEVSDLTVIINNKLRVRFIDCWPTRVTGMNFAANATDMEYLTCDLTLQYDWYVFEDV